MGFDLPDEWKMVKLGEVANFKTGKLNSNAAIAQGEFPFFTCSPETLKIDYYAFDEKAILLAGNNANGNFNIKIYDGKFNAYQRTYVINSNINSKLEYLFYSLKLSLEHFKQISQGTATKFLTAEILKNFIINLPPLPEQHAIADTLSCLDNKIELNNLMSKTLEEMAQAIFKRWFVDFEFPNEDDQPYKSSGGAMQDSELGEIPQGWRVGVLGEVANITMGQSPNGNSYNEAGDGEIFFQGRAEFGWRFPRVRLFTTEPKRMAKIGDALLSVRAPVGDINVANNNCCIGRGLAAISSECQSFVLYLLKYLKPTFDMYNGEGTVFGSINKDTLNNIKIVIPSEDYLISFQNISGEIDNTIELLCRQNQALTAIRDAMLPTLMSGEIRVPVGANENG